MKKGKFIVLLFLALVIAQMSVASHVEATCTPAELSAATCFSAGGYDIRTVPGPNGEFPVNNNAGFCNGAANCFTYSVTQNTTKNISQLDVLIPVCASNNSISNAITVLTGSPSGWHVSAPGDGGQNTSWAYGVYQDYVLEYSFNTTNNFWLATTPARAAKTSMAMHIGTGLYAGAILGPACSQPKIATTTMQKIQLNPNNPDAFIIVTSGTDGTVESVVDNTGTELTWHDLSELGPVNGLPVTYMPDGSVMKTGTNSCYSYFYLGRYCTRCY